MNSKIKILLSITTLFITLQLHAVEIVGFSLGTINGLYTLSPGDSAVLEIKFRYDTNETPEIPIIFKIEDSVVFNSTLSYIVSHKSPFKFHYYDPERLIIKVKVPQITTPGPYANKEYHNAFVNNYKGVVQFKYVATGLGEIILKEEPVIIICYDLNGNTITDNYSGLFVRKEVYSNGYIKIEKFW